MTKFARRLTVTLLACLSWASIAGAEETPRWIVDADAPGPDLPPVGRSLFDFLVAVEDGGKTVLRVPYPQGFFARGLDGRIDDPHAGWKGRGVWATYGEAATWHIEGGKGVRPGIVKFQVRPDPLAN